MYDQSIPTVGSLDSPLTLENYCLDFICDHLTDICVLAPSSLNQLEDKKLELQSGGSNVFDRSFSESAAPSPGGAEAGGGTEDEPMDEDDTDDRDLRDDRLQEGNKLKSKRVEDRGPKRDDVLKFPCQDIYFPGKLSEQLLERLCEKDLLNDLTMSLFDAKSTRLQIVRITNGSMLSQAGLQSLSNHNIIELECKGLKPTYVGHLVDSLNDWTLANCRTLNVSKSSFTRDKDVVLTCLSRFQQVTNLNVSGTDFNKVGLEMVVEDLPFLESLDISGTKVTDLTSLVSCRDRLRALSMYALKLPSSETAVEVLVQLHQLRHLDISDDKDDNPLFELEKIGAQQILTRTESWPHLLSIDISGKDNIEMDELKSFIASHRMLRFLGLMLTDACKDDMFILDQSRESRLVVTGSANETQVLESLIRYVERQHYVKKSLSYLFGLTQGYSTPRVDIIKLVLTAANKYPTVFPIQMAATACLFNLSKNDIGQKLHPRILGQIVKVDLDAMETFPQHHQLQKNVLLTICNDRILQEVNFDKYRCAKLVMDCLCAWQDNSMNRMSVAICSILAAKISTQETSQLGSQSRYMNKLLSIVNKKVKEELLDVTLKFTLSALWNLTDESPQTCSVFLQEGGMELFLKVLQTFSSELSVKTKVLGLLNNIAEVRHLRTHLMLDQFIEQLRSLLYSHEIEVSYFAAGIAAHLSSYSIQDFWPVKCITKDQLIEDLACIVKSWDNPESEMVAYRSFRPFFPLMDVEQVYAVQLWAVWAIHHVCSKNPKRYCPMLIEQGGDEVLFKLVSHPDTNENVLKLCGLVIAALAEKKFLTNNIIEAIKESPVAIHIQ